LLLKELTSLILRLLNVQLTFEELIFVHGPLILQNLSCLFYKKDVSDIGKQTTLPNSFHVQIINSDSYYQLEIPSYIPKFSLINNQLLYLLFYQIKIFNLELFNFTTSICNKIFKYNRKIPAKLKTKNFFEIQLERHIFKNLQKHFRLKSHTFLEQLKKYSINLAFIFQDPNKVSFDPQLVFNPPSNLVSKVFPPIRLKNPRLKKIKDYSVPSKWLYDTGPLSPFGKIIPTE
jgi:hypothetical protein